ncbi:MAG: 5'-3' exonuclease H3TH domain-containing protein [Terrimicrobiaceae bacterium]|nr:5'-3' exonuclease H3TH domain-containing protein [Terrimicrobiaceae bacterium]
MRLLLVDGHYYLYRSFFAIRGLTNSRGEPTNAIFGFTKALRRMLADVRPDRAAVIWDSGVPARRSTLQPAYKQQRPSMPEDLRAQEQGMRDLVPLLGIASLSLPDTEADDLIASYAAQSAGEVVIATNDKDILQLVDNRVCIYSTNKADIGSGETFALLGINEVRGKWGVEPAQIADVLALTGDASDNIPGVDGVGQKTAAALVRQFGSVEALLERIGEIASERTRERIVAQRQRVIDNRQMVALDLDLPLPLPPGELVIAPRYPELIEVIRRCEFRTLLAEIEKEAGLTPPPGGGRSVQAELF